MEAGQVNAVCEDQADAKQQVQPSITERLEVRKRRLEGQLAKVNAALDALKGNAELESVVNLIQQASY